MSKEKIVTRLSIAKKRTNENEQNNIPNSSSFSQPLVKSPKVQKKSLKGIILF